ncbi:MAG: hypothetical protein WCS17_03955 [Prevotella sp.]
MVSAPVEAALRMEVALGQTYELLDTQLPWLNPDKGQFVTKIQETSDAFTYLKDQFNKMSDPQRRLPVEHITGTKFPEIDRSRKTIVPGVLKEKGFSLRISKEVLKSVPKADAEIRENYTTAAYWFGVLVNYDMITQSIAGANQTTSAFSPTETWANANGTADPVGDLMGLYQDMDNDGFEGELTDAWIYKSNWYQLQKYLKDVHVDNAKIENIYGVPEIRTDTINIPIIGDVHKIKSSNVGLSAGSILGMDRNHPGLEYHYRIDPEYSTFKIQYYTRGPNGGAVPQETDNFGMHYRWYEEQASRDIIQEFWVEGQTVVKKPYNLIYATGI